MIDKAKHGVRLAEFVSLLPHCDVEAKAILNDVPWRFGTDRFVYGALPLPGPSIILAPLGVDRICRRCGQLLAQKPGSHLW